MKHWRWAWVCAAIAAVAVSSGAADFGSWRYKATITFAGYPRSETLTNFPALVVLGSHIPQFRYDQFDSPVGADLRFTDATGTNELPYEIDTWNTNGNSYVWVRVPQLTSSTAITAYWLQSGATQPAYTTNGQVWVNGYVAVWHLTGSNAVDSTSNRFHGVATGNTNAVGFVGGGQSCAPASARIEVTGYNAAMAAQVTGNVTAEGWAYQISNPGGEPQILSGIYPGDVQFCIGEPNNLAAGFYSGGWYRTFDPAAVPNGSWFHAAGTFDGAHFVSVYRDGVMRNSTDVNRSLATGGSGYRIGMRWDTTTERWNGYVDEVRLQNVCRSSNWVWAAWANVASNSTFNSYGAAEAQLSIANRPATGVTPTSATLNGALASTGGVLAATVYWGPTDGGTNSALWANTNTFAEIPGAVLATNVTLGAADSLYFYRYYATNAAAETWAPTTESLVTGELTLEATDGTAQELTSDTGAFLVTRPAAATNGPLSVWYEIWGSASNGLDYVLSSNVTIQAGATSAVITVTALSDSLYPEPDETVDLTLLPWNGMAGSPDFGTVTISDNVPPLNTWTGVGPWESAANWSCGFTPSNGQAVVIDGSVLMSNSTPNLASFTVNSGRTNTMHGWGTKVSAEAVTIHGCVTHAVNTDTNAADGWAPNARAWFGCSNFTVTASGVVDVDGKGYRGNLSGVTGAGSGPGGGVYYAAVGNEYEGGGAGHGGLGGNGYRAWGGAAYDLVNAPTNPGSGGSGRNDFPAGCGGGAVLIDASGVVTIQGTVTANAGPSNPSHGGGGSGGSILINCARLAGNASGLLRANGGVGPNSSGGGAGGRIAVNYSGAQAANPGVRYQAMNGSGSQGQPGDLGTIYLPDTLFLSAVLKDQLFMGGRLMVPGFDSWSLDSLTVSNCVVQFGTNAFALSVTNEFRVCASGALTLPPGSSVQCGTLTLTNSASLSVYAAASGWGTNYTGLISATGNVTLAANSWIYPYSHPTNGSGVLLQMANLWVSADSGVNADFKGYSGGGSNVTFPGLGYGPGGGRTIGLTRGDGYRGGGAGYGGAGQDAHMGQGGSAYGAASYPFQPGSGGGGGHGHKAGYGGGLIRVEAAGVVTLHGRLTANGEGSPEWGGGGSGGGILVQCQRLDGSATGLMSANGGNGPNQCGGGSGGRIAVLYDAGSQVSVPGVRFSTTPGSGSPHSRGGIRYLSADWGTVHFPNTLFLSQTVTNQIFQSVRLFSPGFTSWSPDSLTISNASLAFGPDGFQLFVTNRLTLGSGGALWMQPGQTLACGDLVLTNGGVLRAVAAATNVWGVNCGMVVSVSNTMWLGGNSWVYPYSDPTSGRSVVFRVGRLTVADATSGFNADGNGYRGGGEIRDQQRPGFGPGFGNTTNALGAVSGEPYRGGGGGYGGVGGAGAVGAGYGIGGVTYGSSNAPVDPGSGGGGGNEERAGYGGGLIRVEADDAITVNGVLSANGAQPNGWGGGGSGGGIWLRSLHYTAGGSALLRACGGRCGPSAGLGGGGGGGGRIAVHYQDASDSAVYVVTGAVGGVNGSTGSVVRLAIVPTPVVNTVGASNVLASTADLWGRLSEPDHISTSAAPTFVAVAWGEADGGTSDWAYTNWFDGPQGYGLMVTNVALPTPNIAYYFRYFATNSFGTTWAPETLTFVPATITVTASDASAAEAGPDTGTFTISRPGTATGAAVTVNFALAGSALLNATYGKDYVVSSTSSVTLAAGFSSATVTVTPLVDGLPESDETVDLALLPGSYLIGTPSNATVTISDNGTIPATNTWTGTGNWMDGAGWSYGAPPLPGQVAVIAGAVTLTNATFSLKGYIVNANCTNTFVGTNATLDAESIAVNGTITHAFNSDTNAADGWQVNNRVNLTCSNLTVSATGLIDTDGKGWMGGGRGSATSTPGYGPGGGKGASPRGGAGAYGGKGGYGEDNAAGEVYGTVTGPVFPGSGGSGGHNWTNGAGWGGGLVQIAALGRVTVDGAISASGTAPVLGGGPNGGGLGSGGSGGGIAITCRQLAGAGGSVRANGGSGWSTWDNRFSGGGGGGGRILLAYDPAAQASVPNVQLAAAGGVGYTTGQVGTLYMPNALFLGAEIPVSLFSNVVVYVAGLTSLSRDHLTVTAPVTLGNAGLAITVANGIEVGAGGALGLGAGASVSCSGLLVTNGGTFAVNAAATNWAGTNYSALVDVRGDVTVGPGSWIFPISDEMNGGAVLFRATNFTVATSGGISADGRGYRGGGGGGTVSDGYGPGKGQGPGGNRGGGGSYGGRGGDGSDGQYPLVTYGVAEFPAEAGSGGGGGYFGYAGNGGGVVRLEALGDVTVHGTLSANGGLADRYGGGGAGGSVLVLCRRLLGSASGLISASGANGIGDIPVNGGGGGGGRVAVLYDLAQQGGNPGVRFAAGAGVGFREGWLGTVYLPDTRFLAENIGVQFQGGRLLSANFTNWAPNTLTMTNSGAIGFGNEGFQLRVTNAVTLGWGGGLVLYPYRSLQCGSLLVTTGGALTVWSSTNIDGAANATVQVAGDFVVTSNAWVYPYSNPTNGGSALFMAANVTVAAGGGFDADRRGYLGGGDSLGSASSGYGPGGGISTANNPRGPGAGHGGAGGNAPSYGTGGSTYDSSNAPVMAGSGGGGGTRNRAGQGGGVVRIQSPGTVTINGTVSANGARTTYYGGGGAGGSVFIECSRLAGSSSAVVRANGECGMGDAAPSTSGGGGGGRVALLATYYDEAWRPAVTGGVGVANGASGTVYYVSTPVIRTLGASNVTSTAELWGRLQEPAHLPGSALPAYVTVFWGPTDGGTNAWAYTNAFPGLQAVGAIVTNVTPPVQGLPYYFRYFASNTAGAVWASETATFLSGSITLEATDSSATEPTAYAADGGVFTVTRPALATNAPLTVSLAIGGTASNGVDYAWIPNTVTIPAGSSNVTIVVQPASDTNWHEGAETVIVSLAPGSYTVGTPSTGTVSIADGLPVTNTWTGTGNWNSTQNWDSAFVPAAGQSVVISGNVSLTNSIASLYSYTLAAGFTNTFDGWNTRIEAANVTINGYVTHATNTDNNAADGWQPNARVWFVCSNFTLGASGAINTDGRGYQGGFLFHFGQSGFGPGGATTSAVGNRWEGGGAGHGGAGANGRYGWGGAAYDLVEAPTNPGSGGSGGYDLRAGDGGGAVLIDASGLATISGTISANGYTTAGHGGGGSGGSILINCARLAGDTNGLVRANGANNGGATGSAGGGAGGRVAVNFNPALQPGNPGVRFQALNGSGELSGELGTIYFPSPALLSPVLKDQLFMGGRLIIPSFASWDLGSLTVSNCTVQIGTYAFALTVTNELRVCGGGGLALPDGSTLRCGTLTLTNSASLSMYAAPTNWAGTNFNALVSVTGAVAISGNSWLYPYSHPTNGGTVLVRMASLAIGAGAGINADAKGYAGGGTNCQTQSDGYGPGRGVWTPGSGQPYAGSGGGYGGIGGWGYCGAPVGTYGAASYPYQPGSGGGGGYDTRSGNGGGAVRLEATGLVQVDGTITANGGSSASWGGGGSGGGVLIVCDRIAGSAGAEIRVNGGNRASNAGGGGGGRIAVLYNPASQVSVPSIRFTAAAGLGVAGTPDPDAGTIYFPNATFLTESIAGIFGGGGLIFGTLGASWSPSSLTISNAVLSFADESFRLTVANNVLLTGAGSIVLPRGSTLSCGGNLTMSGASALTLVAAPTNLAAGSFGALASVAGDVTLSGNSWINPYCDPSNGVAVMLRMDDLTVSADSGVNADSRGYAGGGRNFQIGTVGFGPGAGGCVGTGHNGGGASYGGRGQDARRGLATTTYGAYSLPNQPGSGGGGGHFGRAGSGGGLIQVEAAGVVTLNGTFTANGQSPSEHGGAGWAAASW